ncbi:c-type cytochrome [Luteolibacter algae]|uniref:C-type cytochrome n=1 Tax=Luteolibacter algae TaxID=454151 RepID=A0ABW5D7A6_9BACT
MRHSNFLRLAALCSPWMVSLSARAEDNAAGKAAYEINCMACHQLDSILVGPSLVYISKHYPEGKLAEFLAWAKTPGKKNPKMIEMPSMSHVPDETLAQIHEYILEASKGKVEKKGRNQFKRFKEPKRKLPYVFHTYLPDTSPASVSVVLPGNISICWDTEICHIRYAWEGSQTGTAAGRYERKIEAEPFFKISSDRLFSFGEDQPIEYLGYRLIEGYPEFQYKLGETEVHELIRKSGKDNAWTSTFTLTKAPQDFTLNLSNTGSAKITSDQGKLDGDRLSLSGTETFTLTFSQP